MDQSTIDTVVIANAKYGSYRKTGAALGVPYTTVRDVIKGKHQHVSLSAENRLRLTLGLAPVYPKVTIDACPDCGGVHTGRCHGKAVALRPVRQRVYTTVYAMSVGVLAQAIRERVDV